MRKIMINKIAEYSGKNITLDGWVYNSRRSGKIGFLSLRDGFGIIQCIIEKQKVGEELFESFKKL